RFLLILADADTRYLSSFPTRRSSDLAVMVNNIVRARPQRGLSAAQMLFEIKVEGGITRFMALFNDYNDIQEIGPVRSGRDQFFQDRKSTRLNSSHVSISYAVFCLKTK